MLHPIILFATVWITVLGDCPFFDDISHGDIIYEDDNDRNLTMAPTNYILRFTCDEGYKLTKPQFIYCQEEREDGVGDWSDDLPLCKMLDCPKPPKLKRGRFEIKKGTVKNPVVGSKAKYSCDIGYEIKNANETTLTCVLEDNTAVWNGTLSKCTEKATCVDPGISDDGYRRGSCCFTGDLLKYSCKDGYQLVGDSSIQCLLGGNWSSPKPRCLPPMDVCPDPPSIANGKIRLSNSGVKTGDYYIAMDEVEIICDPGFAFYGAYKFVFCDENLEWDVEFGECKETFCLRPRMPANGSIAELQNNNATKFPEGFEVTYICDDDFQFYSDNVRTCHKGKWSGNEPDCEEIRCYEPNTPENGVKTGGYFGVGSRVEFGCFPAFELLGSVERFCLPNGQWSGELARCNLRSNYCPNPGAPINGKMIGNEFNEGDVVNFTCHEGFRLIGSSSRQCMSDNSWTGEEAFCLGAHEFDNKNDISETLQLSMADTAKGQILETEKFEKKLNDTRKTVIRERKININYPGRYIFYFLFDVSGSVQERNFNASIEFAQALVKKIGITENGARAGAVTFSSKVNIQFFPAHYSTTEEVLDALGKIKYEKGGTATSSALQVVREEIIPSSREHFGEKNVKTVIFLFTDGKANTGGNPKNQGDLLKESGAEIYCIGVTGDIKKNELYDLASTPLDEHVFILKDYLLMDWLVQEITNGTIDFSVCGLARKRHQRARMIGGKVVTEPWPWMAALYFRKAGMRNRPSKLQCGASIINRQWILTAAHCLVEEKKVLSTTDVTIKLGLTHVDNTTLLQEFEAKKFVLHDQYEPNGSFDYDIALMKLNRLIEYNRYVRPVCLPPKELPKNSGLYKAQRNAYATGWGHDGLIEIGKDLQGEGTDNLKQLVLPLQTRNACRESLADHNLRDRFTERMLCAGSGKGQEDTCIGDSGGPLMQSLTNEDKNMYWTQVGIVSWGLGCGQPNTFGFYSHVHHLLPWINKVLDDDKNEI